MGKKNSILDYLKDEINFSLIMSIIIFLFYLLRINTLELGQFRNIVDNIFSYIIMIGCPILVLLNYKNIKISLAHICLTAYMIICIASTYTYVGYDTITIIHDDYYLIEYLTIFISTWYLFMPRKNYSIYTKNKIVIMRFIVFLGILWIDYNCYKLKMATGDYVYWVNRNNLAAMNMAAMYCILSNAFEIKNIIIKIICVLLSLIAPYIIMQTRSRDSFLAIIIFVVLCVLYLVFKHFVKNKKAAIVSILVFVFALLIVIFIFRNQLISIVLKNATTLEGKTLKQAIITLLSGRYYLWSKIPLLLPRQKFFGLGIHTLNRFTYNYGIHFIMNTEPRVTFMHNVVFDALYSGGIVGFIYFAISAILYLYNLFKNIRFKNQTLMISLITLLAFTFYINFDLYFIWHGGVNFVLFLELLNINNEVLNNE